ncbi:hypothetical protein LCGC14_0723890, partial [marine sediment metagenome]
MKLWTKYAQGDCLDQLKRLPEASVDLIVTDPPYGLTPVDPKKPGGGSGTNGFMGKAWDAAVPPVEVWRECLRVLKPGGFAFVMSSPRQDCMARMILNLEDADFVTGFSHISWVYFTGFPKSHNLSKATDRRAGVERKVIGKRYHPTLKDKTKVNRQGKQQFHGNNSIKDEWDITAPSTPEAKVLDGAYAGMQLKPAQEPILVVMKPLDQATYLDQALSNGKGCSWLDDCRIPTGENHANRDRIGERTKDQRYTDKGNTNFAATPGPRGGDGAGRFPANVLVSDDALDDGIKRTTNSTGSHAPSDYETDWMERKFKAGAAAPYGTNSGSASRYFDL